MSSGFVEFSAAIEDFGLNTGSEMRQRIPANRIASVTAVPISMSRCGSSDQERIQTKMDAPKKAAVAYR